MIRVKLCLLGGEFARKFKGGTTADVRFAAFAAHHQDRTKPTTSLTAFIVSRAIFCARAAPSASTASIAAGSARSRFISAPIGPSLDTARSVSAALNVENWALPNLVASTSLGDAWPRA